MPIYVIFSFPESKSEYIRSGNSIYEKKKPESFGFIPIPPSPILKRSRSRSFPTNYLSFSLHIAHLPVQVHERRYIREAPGLLN